MENRDKENKLKKDLGTYILFLFVTGFILCFPIPIESIVNPQKKFSLLLEPIIKWIGIHFFGFKSDFTAVFISDSLGLHILIFLLLTISSFVGFIWLKYIPCNSKKIEYWLKVVISYYLSLILFIYGANKIFKFQFYEPEPNTLFTPLGYLSKDILYWSVTGSSYSYNILIGLIQIMISVFLFFRKTRFIAAAAAVVLFINIVIINLTYDISVKVFSSFLLFISIVLAFPVFKFIYLFFYMRVKPLPNDNEWILPKNSKMKILFYVILKTLVIGIILFESFFIYFKKGVFNGDNSPKYSLFGAYKVSSSEIPVKRVFFHSKGYFIIQDDNDYMKDCKILSFNSQKIRLKDYNNKIYYLNYKLIQDSIFLEGTIDSTLFLIQGKRIDLQKLPLLQSKFHLTTDDIE